MELPDNSHEPVRAPTVLSDLPSVGITDSVSKVSVRLVKLIKSSVFSSWQFYWSWLAAAMIILSVLQSWQKPHPILWRKILLKMVGDQMRRTHARILPVMNKKQMHFCNCYNIGDETFLLADASKKGFFELLSQSSFVPLTKTVKVSYIASLPSLDILATRSTEWTKDAITNNLRETMIKFSTVSKISFQNLITIITADKSLTFKTWFFSIPIPPLPLLINFPGLLERSVHAKRQMCNGLLFKEARKRFKQDLLPSILFHYLRRKN